jgi:uncharacterized membrane protein YfcA
VLGGGGSILTVPIFVYVLGFGAKPAIAMTMPVVGVTSLFGAASHWRAGNVKLREALAFGLVAMAGAYAGARLAVLLSGATQLAMLAVVMLAAAISMLCRSGQPATRGEASGNEPVSRWAMLAVGVGVGMLTGLVGIGGGFLIVPALVLLAHLPMKQAVGTSLVVIAMNSAAGFTGYVGQVAIPWAFVSMFTAVAIVGIVAGAYLVRFVSPPALRRAFGVFLLLVGTAILYQNRGVFS